MAVDTIGTPLKRKEDPRFITGAGSYLDDVKLSNIAHAAILRSPYAHARIRGIDTTAAATPCLSASARSASLGSRMTKRDLS